MKKVSTKGFTLVELLVVIGILGILMASLFPAISSAMLNAKTTAMASNGKKLHTAILQANTSREQAGKGTTVWPQTSVGEGGGDSGGGEEDIGDKAWTSTTEWFKKLFDIDHKGSATYRPEVEDLEVEVLAGSGVPPATGNKLEARNIAWVAVGNIKDGVPDVMPVFVTRNVNYQSLASYLTKYDGKAATPIELGKGQYPDPFQDKAWIVVRKGGGVDTIKAKYSTLDVAFKKTQIEMQQDPPLQFLDL